MGNKIRTTRKGIALMVGSIAIGIVVLCVLVGGLGYLIFHTDEVRTKERLVPQIEVLTKDGVSDTTFIYTIK